MRSRGAQRKIKVTQAQRIDLHRVEESPHSWTLRSVDPNRRGRATGAPDDAAVYSLNIYAAIQRNNGMALRGYDDLTLTMVSAWCLLGN